MKTLRRTRVIGAMVGVLGLACGAIWWARVEHGSTASRQRLSIEILERDVRAHSASLSTRHKDNKDILVLLRSLKPHELKKPTIVVARIAVAGRQQLIITWIADQPAVDEVWLLDAVGRTVLRLRVPDFYTEEHKKNMETVGVVFDMLLDVEEDKVGTPSTDLARLGEIRAVLVRNGEIISNSKEVRTKGE